MAEQGDYNARKHAHISFDVFRDGISYSYTRRRIAPKPIRDDYAAHAKDLLDQLAVAIGNISVTEQDNRLPVEGLKAGAILEVGTLPPAEGIRAQAVKLPKGLEFSTQGVVVLRSERRDDLQRDALL